MERRGVIVGTIDNGATPIEVDVVTLGPAVSVRLRKNYTMLGPQSFPTRPHFTGGETPQCPCAIARGTTIAVLRCEADALIAAGAAVLA